MSLFVAPATLKRRRRNLIEAVPKSLRKAFDYLKMNIFVLNRLNLYYQQRYNEPNQTDAMSKIDKLRKRNSYAYPNTVSNPVDFIAQYRNHVIETISHAETLLSTTECYFFSTECMTPANKQIELDSKARLEGEKVPECSVNLFFIDSLSSSDLNTNTIDCEKMLQKFSEYIVK